MKKKKFFLINLNENWLHFHDFPFVIVIGFDYMDIKRLDGKLFLNIYGREILKFDCLNCVLGN